MKCIYYCNEIPVRISVESCMGKVFELILYISRFSSSISTYWRKYKTSNGNINNNKLFFWSLLVWSKILKYYCVAYKQIILFEKILLLCALAKRINWCINNGNINTTTGSNNTTNNDDNNRVDGSITGDIRDTSIGNNNVRILVGTYQTIALQSV